MPGMVAFRRRWSVGSDDLIVPALFLLLLHTCWILVLVVIYTAIHFDNLHQCTVDLKHHIFGYIIVLAACVVLEAAVAGTSLRGTILNPEPRKYMQYLLYARLVVGFVELAWLIVGSVWYGRHFHTCKPETAKQALLGIMVCNWTMMLLCGVSLWCTYDTAGAKWVKMKEYQDSMKKRRRNNKRQSGSRRNWRQRKAFRAYEESWDRRLQLLCCCVERKGRNKNSMSEIAQLFTEFFRDLDVVPSDIVAGLVLLRNHQKHRMKSIIAQGTNDVYQYLSGVAITPATSFLQLSQPQMMGEFVKLTHYMRYALAAYGCPVYVIMNPGTWFCRLMPVLRCLCCGQSDGATVVDDNCCGCNVASLKRISGLSNLDIVYATYHVDIGETPFFVALDHEHGKVVVCVRGTLSLQDVLTDLKAEPETLPLSSPRDDWQGHKGMVQAAVYIKNKLIDDKILDRAFGKDEGHGVSDYDLVLVGHSLGAGTAAILAILLKAQYPTLHCYAYSPPGGLLTLPCVEETKSFITSVVVGKDVVPRIGLPQLEMLRTDIINLIKDSRQSKWNVIMRGVCCCASEQVLQNGSFELERDVTAHPSNAAIGLSAHTPLYPPGKMIHVVRSHAKAKTSCKGSESIYQAVWASNRDFDEVLVSPTMVNDHMPDKVLESLEKVLLRLGPQKPVRRMMEMDQEVSECWVDTSSPDHATCQDSGVSQVLLNHCVSEAGDTNSWEYSQHHARTSQEREAVDNDCDAEDLREEEETIECRHLVLEQLAEPSIQAPLASPETLSMASVVVGSPLSSIMLGLLNHSDSVRSSEEDSQFKSECAVGASPHHESASGAHGGKDCNYIQSQAYTLHQGAVQNELCDSALTCKIQPPKVDGLASCSQGSVGVAVIESEQTQWMSSVKEKQMDGIILLPSSAYTDCAWKPAQTSLPVDCVHQPPGTWHLPSDAGCPVSVCQPTPSVHVVPTDSVQRESDGGQPVSGPSGDCVAVKNAAPHPFVHCQSDSSIFSKNFPPKSMKRSAERSDICHLEDEVEVFTSNEDLFAMKRSVERSDICHLSDEVDVFGGTETEDVQLVPSVPLLAE